MLFRSVLPVDHDGERPDQRRAVSDEGRELVRHSHDETPAPQRLAPRSLRNDWSQPDQHRLPELCHRRNRFDNGTLLRQSHSRHPTSPRRLAPDRKRTRLNPHPSCAPRLSSSPLKKKKPQERKPSATNISYKTLQKR